jgi:hypothetical protein
MGNDRIMTPEHPGWSEFITKLSRARICHGTTKEARGVMGSMQGIDVEGSLRALADLGGTCDCRIELDVALGAEQVQA